MQASKQTKTEKEDHTNEDTIIVLPVLTVSSIPASWTLFRLCWKNSLSMQKQSCRKAYIDPPFILQIWIPKNKKSVE